MTERRCHFCGAHNPDMIQVENWYICAHRRACQARQMIARGMPVEEAAAHAQGRLPRLPYPEAKGVRRGD